MGRIRSALRAYTLLELPPDEVLRLVDRKVKHFEIGTFATIACAVADPPFDTMTLALAGHPPPVIASPGQPAAFPPARAAPPVGMGWTGRGLASTVLPIAPGTTVAFYTDGLVERRGESIDAGLERLRSAITHDPPPRVTADLMHRLVGTTITDDDIALVVARRTPASASSADE
jgi:serine phosphatase RsbU (regulator of sigma subunit)